MRTLLVFAFSLLLMGATAQKYALLDKRLLEPVSYADHITPNDKLKGLFPVEKTLLPQFLTTLQEIAGELSSKGRVLHPKQYRIGCIVFKGVTVPSEPGERLDYVITSKCENIAISFHLSDARNSNPSNAFFIKTWIKYISDSK